MEKHEILHTIRKFIKHVIPDYVTKYDCLNIHWILLQNSGFGQLHLWMMEDLVTFLNAEICETFSCIVGISVPFYEILSNCWFYCNVLLSHNTSYIFIILYTLHRIFTKKYFCVKIIHKLNECIKWILKNYSINTKSVAIYWELSMAIQGAQKPLCNLLK